MDTMSQSHVRPYQYPPLAAGEIRLLQIQPRTVSGFEVTCVLKNFMLESIPPFAALSYCWGDEMIQHPIIINDCLLTVSTNLYEYLRESSNQVKICNSSGESILGSENLAYIWIDALCINQQDNTDKANQVKMMHKIYSKSSKLIVWLGPELSDSALAFSALRRLTEIIQTTKSSSMEEDYERFNPTAEEWRAVYNLFTNPYFARSWIVQEYALGGSDFDDLVDSSNTVEFCCGQHQIMNLVDLGTSSGPLALSKELFPTFKDSMSWHLVWEKMFWLRRMRFTHHSSRLGAAPLEIMREPVMSFSSLLLAQLTRMSKDPRDKVYSVLGLAEALGAKCTGSFLRDEIIIDYNASTEDVFSSSVRSVVRATGRLDILGAAIKANPANVTRSWTPDWSQSRNMSQFSLCRAILYEGLDSHPIYDCSLNVKGVAEFSDDLSSLTVRGIELGRVEYMTPRYSTFLEVSTHTKEVFYTIVETLRQMGVDKPWRGVAELLLGFLDRSEPESFDSAGREWASPLEHIISGPTAELLYSHIVEHVSATKSREEKGTNQYTAQNLVLAIIVALQGEDDNDRIFISSGGFMGRSNHCVRKGDLLCLVLGCARPLILRETGCHFKLVGEAFVSTIRNGEIIREWEEGKWMTRDFLLR